MEYMQGIADESDSPPLRAAQACLSCRKQKRKCDKGLPGCSLCTRMGRSCDYSDNTTTPLADDFAFLKQRIADLEARLEGRSPSSGKGDTSSQTSRSIDTNLEYATPPSEGLSQFPSLFFLDAEIFHEARISIPKPNFPIPRDVIGALGSITDIRDVVDRYFNNIHSWLPMVSKKRTQLILQNPFFELTPDFALLLLTMKLITQGGSGSPQAAQTQLYSAVKKYLATVIANALISVQTVQSSLLVAAYEIGHAIYPAAYLTTGESVRLCHGLGINDRRAAPQMLRRTGAWAEIEERKRVWWAAMLLDRYVNLGSRGHPLATEEPAPNDVLPADDSMWDEGEMATSEPVYITTPTNVRAGAFQRTCQATHLIGKLIRLLNDQVVDAPFRFSEALLLHRTTRALSHLLPGEVHQFPEKFGTPLALCYSLLLNLYDPFCCPDSNRGGNTVEETEMQATSIAGLKHIAAEVLQFSQLLKMMISANLPATSPLVIECLYQAACTYAWQGHESGNAEAFSAYHSLRDILITINKRWAVAGEYLKALDAARETLYDNNSLL